MGRHEQRPVEVTTDPAPVGPSGPEPDAVEQLLDLARRQLGMDVAFVGPAQPESRRFTLGMGVSSDPLNKGA